jgi:hypothetical protein
MALTALGIRLAFEPFRPTGPPCFVCRISVLTQTNVILIPGLWCPPGLKPPLSPSLGPRGQTLTLVSSQGQSDP